MIGARTAAPFRLDARHLATEPPEAGGTPRDEVRLMVAEESSLTDTTFRLLPAFLRPGDLLVVNDSATMPAAIAGVMGAGVMGAGVMGAGAMGTGAMGSRPIVVHVSQPLAGGRWLVELRHPDQSGPLLAAEGRMITVDGGVSLRLITAKSARLWVASVESGERLDHHLRTWGRPIRYSYVRRPWPLHAYQTVFARETTAEFGSAEMPSAARPFTARVVADLAARDITIASITLHTGVSSPELGEPPMPERFEVPADTVGAIAETRRAGGRVIAVGTTTVRALETVAAGGRRIRSGRGWTDLVISPGYPVGVVDGILTGWHPPEASHLHMLDALAGTDRVDSAYRRAVHEGYRWHEFGDSCLFLP